MNLFPSLIRTYVPLIVGYLVGWLATLGITVTSDQQVAIIGAIGTIAAGVYYTVVRLLEKKFPWATVLLGSSVQPTNYQSADTAVSQVLPSSISLGVEDDTDLGAHAAT